MPDWLVTIVLATSRIAAMVLVVPGVSSQVVTWRMRLVLVALLTVPVLCVIPPFPEADLEPAKIFGLLLQELSVGVSLALVPAALILGLRMATDSLQGMTGLPGGNENGALPGHGLSRLFYVVSLTVFFASSGHRHLFQSVLDSFHWMPVGTITTLDSTKEILVELVGKSFQLGVRAVAPIAASLAVGVLVLGAINRVIPQLGYFAVGMSIQTTILLAALVMFLGSVGLFIDAGFESSIGNWQATWQAAHKVVYP